MFGETNKPRFTVRETEKIRFILSADDIVHIECLPNTVMTITEGIISTMVVREIVNSTPLPMLCDLTNVVRLTRECREHFAGPEHAAIFTRCALIVSSPIAKIIGNFFLGANAPLRPTRLFTNKVEALKWLKR